MCDYITQETIDSVIERASKVVAEEGSGFAVNDPVAVRLANIGFLADMTLLNSGESVTYLLPRFLGAVLAGAKSTEQARPRVTGESEAIFEAAFQDVQWTHESALEALAHAVGNTDGVTDEKRYKLALMLVEQVINRLGKAAWEREVAPTMTAEQREEQAVFEELRRSLGI